MQLALPTEVNILGTPYKVTYVDKASDVCHRGQAALFGEIDMWECDIRILKGKRPTTEVWKTLLHEIMHGLSEHGNIPMLNDEENHDDLDTLSELLMDTFIRNGWIVLEN